jgi:hypothetical protein
MNSSSRTSSYPGKIDIPYDQLYAPEIFGRVSFPHRDPKSTTYLRKDNEYIFSIESGYKYVESSGSLEPYGIPFGIYPRILLLLITSYAKHQKRREIILSENITKFMREKLGYDLTGGETGTLNQLNNQLDRLLNCRLCFRRNKKTQNGRVKKTTDYFNQISKIELWESGEGTKSDSQIKAVLSESYYNWIRKTAYPVDLKTVEAMRSSLLALDLYLFLCSRTFRINPKKYETYISWASLEKQLGTNYKKTKEFARRARKEVKKIKEWYPQLNVRFERGCLVLVATSKPHIKSYPQKQVN